MTTSQSSNLRSPHRGRRRLILVTVAALLFLLVAVLVALLVRGLAPRAEPVLRLAPAAAAVDEQTTLLVSGSGWRRDEEVAICASSTDDILCDAESALKVIRADYQGAIEVDVLAGPLLAQGMTIFIASGIESGQVATRSFRLLKTADGVPIAVVPSMPTVAPADLAPVITTGTPSSQSIAPVAGSWLGEYFANPDLSGTPAFSRGDSELVFDWALQAPDLSLPQDGFSVRWSQRIPFAGGSYRFLATADGGLRVTVDGQMVIDQWQDAGTSTAYTAVTELSEGEHDLVVAYVDSQGAASMALRWEALTTFADWRGEYFANPELAGEPSLVRNDVAVDFDWGEASPAPGQVPADEFSTRWTRTLPFTEGSYRFSITANDGARVLVDNQVLIDAWSGSSDQAIAADIQLLRGDHQIIVLFVDNTGPARVALSWSPVLAATPAGVVVVPPQSQTPSQPGEPVSSPTPTWTLTPLGSTATPTQTVSTSTPVGTPSSTPTPTPTGSPGSSVTPTPTATPTATPQRDVRLNPSGGPVDTLVEVSISGQWTPGTPVIVVLLPRGATIPSPDGQAVSTTASATILSDGSARMQFRVPNDSRLLGQQPIQLVVRSTGDWREWSVKDFSITQ